MTMADRIAVMDKGHIMRVATPVEVYEAPSSRFVADFIGNVNMFEGRVESLGEGRVSIATNDGIAINSDCTGNPAKGSMPVRDPAREDPCRPASLTPA